MCGKINEENLENEKINNSRTIMQYGEDFKTGNIILDGEPMKSQPYNGSIILTNLVKSGTASFYNHGKNIIENTPMIDHESNLRIRMDCRKMQKNLENKKELADKYEYEYELICDIIDLINEVVALCDKNRNEYVLDYEVVYKISVSFFRACHRYEELFISKGWEL